MDYVKDIFIEQLILVDSCYRKTLNRLKKLLEMRKNGYMRMKINMIFGVIIIIGDIIMMD